MNLCILQCILQLRRTQGEDGQQFQAWTYSIQCNSEKLEFCLQFSASKYKTFFLSLNKSLYHSYILSKSGNGTHIDKVQYISTMK